MKRCVRPNTAWAFEGSWGRQCLGLTTERMIRSLGLSRGAQLEPQLVGPGARQLALRSGFLLAPVERDPPKLPADFFEPNEPTQWATFSLG